MQTHYKLLTDSQWQVIKTCLPMQRKRKHDLRDVVNGILWILRTGSQWRNLPKEFPKWQVVYYYFRKWKADGVPDSLTWKLNALLRRQKSKEPHSKCIIY